MTRLLLDQGMPRSTCDRLEAVGIECVHVADLGMSRATDATIVEFARARGMVIVTLDSDFHTHLALSAATAPSVIRIRREGLKAEPMAQVVADVLLRVVDGLKKGALVTVTERAIRIRQLPIR